MQKFDTIEANMMREVSQSHLDKATEVFGGDIHLNLTYKGHEGLEIQASPCPEPLVGVMLIHSYLSYLSAIAEHGDEEDIERENMLAAGLLLAMQTMVDLSVAEREDD